MWIHEIINKGSKLIQLVNYFNTIFDTFFKVNLKKKNRSPLDLGLVYNITTLTLCISKVFKKLWRYNYINRSTNVPHKYIKTSFSQWKETYLQQISQGVPMKVQTHRWSETHQRLFFDTSYPDEGRTSSRGVWPQSWLPVEFRSYLFWFTAAHVTRWDVR